jgi:sodium/hydrogen exchanger 8
VFQFLGFAAEAFIFSYLGLTFFSYNKLKWSPQLFLAELLIIMIGRSFGTFGLVGLFKMLGIDHKISLKELTFIWYAGLIRGAIAFGLVLRIDGAQFKNRDVIVTTSLTLVVFTTVFFGSTVGVLRECLFSKKTEVELDCDEALKHPSEIK